MRKNALANLAIVVGAGAFGSFCRWLQNQIAFDENGLSTNSPLNILVFLVVLGAAIWFFLIVQGIHEKNMTVSDNVRTALKGTGDRQMTAPMIIAAVGRSDPHPHRAGQLQSRSDSGLRCLRHGLGDPHARGVPLHRQRCQ